MSRLTAVQTVHDQVTEKDHQVFVELDAYGVRIYIGEDNQGEAYHAALEIFDGKLAAYIWSEGCEAPDGVRIPLDQLMDEDNDDPHFEHIEGDQ